jgi:hypothetical protein
VLEAKGVTGRLSVEGDFVVIRRKGALAKMNYGWTRGEKRIPIRAINAVQMKRPGVSNGYIQFTLGGGAESTKGLMAATKDENSVIFRKRSLREFEAIRHYVEEQIGRASPPGAAPPPPVTPRADIPEQLRKLAELRDAGVITHEEFDAKKTDLLSRM